MNPSTILLANYPKSCSSAQFVLNNNPSKELSVLVGYDLQFDQKQQCINISNDLISSLFTYEKILIFANNITELLESIGYDDLIVLLRLHYIQIIPDSSFSPALIKEGNSWRPDFFGYSVGNGPVIYDHKLGHIEYWLHRNGYSKLQINTLLVLLEENSVDFDETVLGNSILAEHKSDLQRIDFLSDPEFFRVNKGRLECNMISELRLLHLDMLLCVASQFSVEGLKADGAINSLICKKVVSQLQTKIPDGVEAINRISIQKGLPNIGELYYKKIININDVVLLRNSFDGKMFRYWAKCDDYQEENMRKDIMNSVDSILGSKVASLIRMAVSNCIGILGFVPGIVSDAFDSFVIDKLAKGWHPNLFLDNGLKSLIDSKISKYKRDHDIEILKERFKGVDRNDLCPCGSGKKFKKCHGKDLF